jgi:diguanylate cyclase (GGDEF)-like protein
MALVVAAPMLGYALPVALAHLGWIASGGSIVIIGETAGIACAMAPIGLILLLGPAPTAGRGRRLVGAACLAYVVSYAGVIAQELRPGPHQELISLAPLVFDQILLGILNFGLLAMPAERAQEALRQLAFRDALTGVSNRAGFDAKAARLLAPGSISIAIDVDHFKLINDTHGHDMGDDILRALAREAAALVERAGGEFGRVGGDEFIAVLPAAVADPEFLCERLRTVPRHAEGDLPPWTVSIGIARVEPEEAALAAAFKRADRFLYRAKAKGRNSVAA